jgi:NADH-quinone oxidoreductase subunit C
MHPSGTDPAEVGRRLVDALGGAAEASVSGGGSFARATVDVAATGWRDAIRTARDALGCDFFDWLTAVDELDDGFAVVAHLWSTAGRFGVLVRTRVPRAGARIDSIVEVYPGAAWPERETFEMFDIDFAGHPDLQPLLLPPQFEGHPLRKEFVLASRVAKTWPGAKEPGESHDASAARRSPMRPPGVPDPAVWGPHARPDAAEPAPRPEAAEPAPRPEAAEPAPRPEAAGPPGGE